VGTFPEQKLSPDIEEQIVTLRREGVAVAEIVQRLGLSKSTVYRVCQRRGADILNGLVLAPAKHSVRSQGQRSRRVPAGEVKRLRDASPAAKSERLRTESAGSIPSRSKQATGTEQLSARERVTGVSDEEFERRQLQAFREEDASRPGYRASEVVFDATTNEVESEQGIASENRVSIFAMSDDEIMLTYGRYGPYGNEFLLDSMFGFPALRRAVAIIEGTYRPT
jgi:hypothetical protein